MHAMSPELIVSALIRGDRPPPDKTSELSVMAGKVLYINPDDKQPAIPRMVSFASLREAGRGVKVGKGGISTATSTKIPGFMKLSNAWSPLLNGEGKPVTDADWVPDVQRGQMGATKTAVGIVRPRFDKWSVVIAFEILCYDGFTEESAFKLFEIAGQRVGIMAFRPQKNGPFGCYEIANWQTKQIPVTDGFKFEPIKIDGSMTQADYDEADEESETPGAQAK
jgi:hypothetical protein